MGRLQKRCSQSFLKPALQKEGKERWVVLQQWWFQLDVRRTIFIVLVIEHWKGSAREHVSSPSLGAFKTPLDRSWVTWPNFKGGPALSRRLDQLNCRSPCQPELFNNFGILTPVRPHILYFCQGHAQLSALEGITLLHICIYQVVEKKEQCAKETISFVQLSLVWYSTFLPHFRCNKCCYKGSLPFSLSTTRMSTPYLVFIALNVVFNLNEFFSLTYLLFMGEMILHHSLFLSVTAGCQNLL